MQPTAQISSQFQPVGNGVNGSVPPALLSSAIPQQAAQPVVQAQPRPEQESVLRHVGADPHYTQKGPVSPEELRWATICQLKTLQQSNAPLPTWLNYTVQPIKAGVVDQAGPSAAGLTSSAPTATAAYPAAVPQPPASSPSGGYLRHPDPNSSIEELRWRDYQALSQNHAPGASAAGPAGPPQAVAGAPQGAALLGPPSAPVVPNTPIFPTPVRTLFPPTPAAAGPAGGLMEGYMDTSDGPDAEQCFQCIYAAPGNCLASPEEMRVVQIESYKLGKQVVPYWLVSGA